MDSKLWAASICGGSKWSVTVSDDRKEKDLENNQGVCKISTHQILLNRNEAPPEALRMLRFHEEFHAAAYTSGATLCLQHALSLDESKMEALEELINRTYGQAMFDYLDRNGYLTYEPIPV